MGHPARYLGGAAAIVVVVAVVVMPTRQAGAGPSAALPSSIAGIPLPSLPGLPVPLPSISPPKLPLPPLKPPTTGPGAPAGTPTPAPDSPDSGGGAQPGAPGTTGAADGTVTGAVGGADDDPTGVIIRDPGADLYPQPPVDPITTPQAQLVAQLNEVERRVQYLRNVLTRSRAELAAAQAKLGPVPQLITHLAAPNPPSPGLRDTAAAPVLTLAAAIDADEAELAQREAEAETLRQRVNQGVQDMLAAGAVITSPGSPPAPGKLLRPVAGPITSRFGPRLDPFYHVWQVHKALDIAAPAGTEIIAAAGGRVTQAGWSGGLGNYTCIDHGQFNGQRLSTCYGHQQAILVTPGQQVSAGQVIGRVGSTGKSTGPHVHFQVLIGGRPVDPLPWI
jgi:murein DD-endopeptidase MepM/ murein hydrolase activator NlpD